ncbi:PleD family two-component system response regulator [Mucilaginibacter sp. UR6-11]|uniref:response regulator n=1 Tax=Mucilaginibacter sp. UR6-11 TaxID=1435644 RepID=UPI001E575DAD|nr:response regulator [Mucilaginibacter sp. UR6-11]MCC8426340.1 response regulator [Mucilaginibacter sp. UR6-11]
MKSKKILILDDDDDVLEILALLLSDAGYETRTSVNGETVFEDITNFQPNLVLMDIVLGDVDGRAICQHIKQNDTTAHLPVILISGQHDLVEYMHLPGAPNDFVAKPFSIDHLLAKVAQQVL